MKISIYTPIDALKPYVHMIWVMENNEQIADNDIKSIAPNGNPRIIIPIESELMYVRLNEVSLKPNTNMGMIVGQQLTSAWVDCQGKNKVIGVELNPATAYKLIRQPMIGFTNTIINTNDVFGASDRQIHEQLNDNFSIGYKIYILQQYLFKMISRPVRQNNIVEYLTNTITKDFGLTNIKILCQKVGYTQRHIDNLFKNYIGVSPKTFSCIIRFNMFYKRFYDSNNGLRFKMDDLYDYYFDQTHFIKEFKRFTGYSPNQLYKQENVIGKLFSNIG